MAEAALLVGTAASVGGALFRGQAAKREGENAQAISNYNAQVSENEGISAQRAAEFQAVQLERAADEERVAGQRAAFEQRHQRDRVLSAIRAGAASSGAGGMETPTVADIYRDASARGEYLAQVETYGGESRARGRLDQAAAARYGGEAAMQRATNQAASERMQGSAARSRGENAFYGSILEGVGAGARGIYTYNERYGARPARVAFTDPNANNLDDPTGQFGRSRWAPTVRYG